MKAWQKTFLIVYIAVSVVALLLTTAKAASPEALKKITAPKLHRVERSFPIYLSHVLEAKARHYTKAISR